MSQYAYIPIERSDELLEFYSISTPATWTFERMGIIYGGLEEEVFSDIQKAEIRALEGQYFNNVAEFTFWLTSINNSLSIPITPLADVERMVEVYDMKINYSDKIVRLFTRCIYSDERPPKYVMLTADNNTLFPDGNGGTIGEYDYLYYRIYSNHESLAQVQTEIIQMRATFPGGAKWD